MSAYINYKRQKNSEDEITTSKYYLSNSILLPAVINSRILGHISKDLAEMLFMLATRYSLKPSFSRYTFREDMIAEALTDLCKNALKFNPNKSTNPFAYYTSCIHNSFLGFLNNEKRQRTIRDQILVELGENPSYGFQEEYKANLGDETVREELTSLKNEIAEARDRLEKDKLKEQELKKLEKASLGLLVFNDEDQEVLKSLPLIFEEEPLNEYEYIEQEYCTEEAEDD